MFLCQIILVSIGGFAKEYPQQEFVANISSSVPDLRPHHSYNADEAQILTALYEGLFVYDPYNLEPLPALAESYVTSKDGLTWTFTIRQNARFETGEAITSETIKDSWIRLLSPEIQAPYASLFDAIEGALEYRLGIAENPHKIGIKTPDSQTLILHVIKPVEHLPKLLCHHAFSAIHPKDLFAQNADNFYTPISSGSFKIKAFTSEHIIFEKNTYYWDFNAVALPSIKIVISDDSQELTAAYNKGDIHWLAGAMSIDKIIDFSSVHITPMFSTEYFFFRTTWGLGSNSLIRKALLLSLPWDVIRKDYLIPATTLVFPIDSYPLVEGIKKTNIEEAVNLLKEAGLENPENYSELIINVPQAESYITLANIIKSAWEDLGFTVKIKANSYANYYETLKENDYTIGITSWIGDFADPLAFLELFRHNSNLNDSGWNENSFSTLLDESASIRETKERYKKLAEAEQLLLSESVILPISHNPALNVFDTNEISGWYANPLDIHPFKFLKFIEKKPLPGVASLY